MYCRVKWSFHKRIEVFQKRQLFWGESFWDIYFGFEMLITKVPSAGKTEYCTHSGNTCCCAQGNILEGLIPSWYTVIGEVFQVNVLPSWGQYNLFKIILSLCHCLWLFYGYSLSCFITTWWLILIKYGTVSAHLWSFGCLGWMPCPLQMWLLNAITLATTWWQHCPQRAHQIVELPAAVEPWPSGAR